MQNFETKDAISQFDTFKNFPSRRFPYVRFAQFHYHQVHFKCISFVFRVGKME